MTRSGRWLVTLLLLPQLFGCSGPENVLVQACLRSTACGVRAYPRVSNCVETYRTLLTEQGLAPVYDEIYRCTVAARDCEEIRACFGVTTSCGQDFNAQCEAGTAIFCDLIDHTTFALDCAAAGLDCQLDPQASFAATCAPPAGSPPDTAPSLPTTVDCGDGSCEKTGSACSTDEFDRCQGDELQVCLEDEWVTFDCAELGLGPCLQAEQWGNCTPPG